jgi:hypothetical protein
MVEPGVYAYSMPLELLKSNTAKQHKQCAIADFEEKNERVLIIACTFTRRWFVPLTMNEVMLLTGPATLLSEGHDCSRLSEHDFHCRQPRPGEGH